MANAIRQDVHYALRMLVKSPTFTIVAVASLAIGIGANTAIFSVANALLLRPLPLAESNRLVSVHKVSSEGSGNAFQVSYPDYQYYRDHNEVLSGLLCWGEASLSLSAGEQAEQAFGMVVSGNYFDVLGIRPTQGRFFLPEEDQTPGTHPVAVLSYGLWQRRFGGDPATIGRTIKLNGQLFSIIGIAPQNFTSTIPLIAPDVWVPIMMQPQILHASDMLVSRNARWLGMTGRLRPGVPVAQAQAQLSALALQINAAHPEDNRLPDGTPMNATLLGVALAPVGSFPVEVRGTIVGFLGLLLGVVGLVLLIACANLSSLLLTRATARRREIAVRLALGASRGRIIRQLLTESVLLCLVSGAAGVLFALWLMDLLLAFKPSIPLPLDLNFGLDWRVLGWTFGLSLVTGVLFGLVPALQASKPDLLSALKDEASMRGYRKSRMRDLFVIGQVAMSLLLLVSAGLFLRAVTRAHTFFPGEHPEHVLTVTLDPGMLGYDDARTRGFYRQLLERVETLPSVESVALANGIPIGNGYSMTAFDIKARDTMSGFNTVTPEYFRTMRIPVLRGRNFSDADRAGAPRVAIIDETLARRFFPREDPIGQYLGSDHDLRAGKAKIEIVGVVRGGQDDATDGPPRYFIYLPVAQPLFEQGFKRMILHVRTANAPQDMFVELRREVGALDPNMPLLNTTPLTEAINTALLPQRLVASIAGGFGVVGLALAAIGIFGLVSYTVAQRTHEIGIRMALGAQQADVLRMVLRQGLRVTSLGLAIGLALAFAVTRLLSSLLYGVSATDPATFVGVSLLLCVVAMLACYIPARRATRADPIVALRYE